MVMIAVGVAELKAKLSENLAKVRRGETITVLDRKMPVARIVPYQSGSEPLSVRKAAGKRSLGAIRFPPRVRVRQDVVDFLVEDRARR
jgi:prevent-host-death family protein